MSYIAREDAVQLLKKYIRFISSMRILLKRL